MRPLNSYWICKRIKIRMKKLMKNLKHKDKFNNILKLHFLRPIVFEPLLFFFSFLEPLLSFLMLKKNEFLFIAIFWNYYNRAVINYTRPLIPWLKMSHTFITSSNNKMGQRIISSKTKKSNNDLFLAHPHMF